MSDPHPLSIPSYRAFWLARFSAVVATTAMIVVIGWQAYDIARSDYGMSVKQASLQLGLLGLAQFVPLFLLTPVAGWVADRFERRLIARLANSADLLVCLALGLCTYWHILNLPILFTIAALHGIARVFVNPAMSAIAPSLVPPSVLPRAVALNAIAWQSGSIFGPAMGGLLYGIVPELPYWVAAGFMLIANFAITTLPKCQPPAISGNPHPVHQMIDGLRYTWNERFLLGAISLDLFAVLLGGATALMPAIARDYLHVGAVGLGQLRAAPALGAAVIALLLAFRPMKHDVGVKMLWSVVVFGIATIGFGLSHEIGPVVIPGNSQIILGFTASMLVALLMLAILGGADMLSVYVRGSLVQLNTPDEMRGRVGAASTLAISASNELGELQSGVAAAILGPVGAVVFGGVGAIIVTAIWSVLFPELKNARTFEPQYRDKKP